MPNSINNTVISQDYVLDSFAILSYLENEKGSDRIKSLLEAAACRECTLSISAVNWGEVAYIVERERGLTKAQEILALIEAWPLEINDIDQNLALTAAHLKAITAISYADCFAAALSITKKAVLVTGDPEFRKIKPTPDLQIEWLVTA